MTNIAIENGYLIIVDFPNLKMVMFHSSVSYPLVNVYITNWKDPPYFMGKITINQHFQ